MGADHRPFWGHDGRAGRVTLWELLFAFVVVLWAGGVPGTAVDDSQYGRYADLRIGICNGQLCYSNRTVAGATPPLAEDVIGLFFPVLVRRAMASNLAGDTIVSVPLWPLPVLAGWPVARWLGSEWAARHRFSRGRRRIGFEPILPVITPAEAGQGGE